MKVLMVILAILFVSPAWADEYKAFEYDGKVMVLAMKGFEVGPQQAGMRMKPQFGGSAGAALTNHVLLEDGNNLAAEDGKIITKD